MSDWNDEESWDDAPAVSIPPKGGFGGKSFSGSGRGFTPFIPDEDNSYGNGAGHGTTRYDGRDTRKKFGGDNDDRNRRDGRDRGSDRDRGQDRDRDQGKPDGEIERPKVTYIPDEIVAGFDSGISSGINFDKYESIPVEVTGENSPEPIVRFEDSGLHPVILENVRKSGYNKPTPVQKRAIPIIMNKRDTMACAQTGSGKTAAFLLPIIDDLMNNAEEAFVSPEGCSSPQAVIVSPTRELAIQIFTEALKFSNGPLSCKLKCCIAYGGTAPFQQSQSIRRGCHILVATTGRLMDYVRRNTVNFKAVRFVVLDEADRMLDMGFMPDVEKIMEHETMPAKGERTTLMFSATFPTAIQKLASRFLNNYLFIAVGIVGGACSDVEQTFYKVSKFEKKKKLRELLQTEGSKGVLVFVETKRNADFIAIFLAEEGFPTTSIHGDRLQREREEALRDFKSGRCGVLVATAVAARGLDIKNVKHVVNYDLPKQIDEYVHRIGRTGRVGNSGQATSFYDEEHDSGLANELVLILKQAGKPIPDFLESFGGSAFHSEDAFGGEDIREYTSEPVEDWD